MNEERLRHRLAEECYRMEYGRDPRPGVDLDLYRIRKSMPDWFVREEMSRREEEAER